MSLATLSELRTNIAATVRDTQIADFIDGMLNLTLAEIHQAHPWTWKRRKTTFDTVASQEDYNLDEEVDQVACLRELTSATRLLYIPDRLFYSALPNPESTSTGTPRYYRQWEETGFLTNLAAADTVYVSSSSAADGSSFRVILVGRRSSDGLVVAETLTLNGVTAVTSSTTWAAGGLLQVSKSATTTGTITVARTTGDTVLSRLGPTDPTPRSKRLSLYPIPSSALTLYLEYYERLRPLVNDADVPQMDTSWIWVLREGALAKVWSYKQNEAAAALSQQLFDRGLKQMRTLDAANRDWVPVLQPRLLVTSVLRHQFDSVSNAFPGYALAP